MVTKDFKFKNNYMTELELKNTTPNNTKPVLAVRCVHSHEDGLTKGKTYYVRKQNDWGYDIFPDDYGHLSGWNKRYFY